jgi:hypothetical protein
LLFLALGCKNAQETKYSADDFNEQAAEIFLKKGSENLAPLSEKDKCILVKEIKENLDELNDWSAIQVDSFLIREYISFNAGTRFEFIRTKDGRFYFLFLPKFYQYYWGKEAYHLNTKKFFFELDTVPGNYVVDISSPFVDSFFNEAVFEKRSVTDQIIQSQHLLSFVLKEALTKEVFLPDLSDSIQRRPQNQQIEIHKVLDPILKKENSSPNTTHQFKIYWNEVGFVIVDFAGALQDSRLKLSFLLVPHQTHPMFPYEIEPGFSECFR